MSEDLGILQGAQPDEFSFQPSPSAVEANRHGVLGAAENDGDVGVG
ncbi:MAG TPA: hypothetical protein VGV93_05880 [Acidimicrobiales bacterium]|nr:hypothetical protein [Acidimicrobiales bacterium]